MRHLVTKSFDEWRTVCRGLLAAQIAPADVRFTDDAQQKWLGELHADLSVTAPPPLENTRTPASPFHVQPAFIELAREVACHRDKDRFDLLYRALWRITHGQPNLLEIATDPEVHRLTRMQKAIARDVHKMHAFVRFRRAVNDRGVEHFIAWHRPDHRIVQLAAPFFSRRFPTMNWSILTPDESVHWDQAQLTYTHGVPASEAPKDDQLENLWRTYYRSIFNPARVNQKTMKREMPVRHWRTLPEATEVSDLVAQANRRVATMVEQQVAPATAMQFIPPTFDLPTLAAAARGCQGCRLCEPATQVVFGEGPSTARLVLIGEQPGDEEDRQGRPFVGPAGKVLDAALREAGIVREQIYLTNAVKHFKFEQRATRRLHQRPTNYDIQACRPWLLAELSQLRPELIVCLGATAIQSVLRRRDRLSDLRGQILESPLCPQTIATYHPSAVLRAGNPEHEREIRDALVADLLFASRTLAAAA